jgi:hypothetical protein
MIDLAQIPASMRDAARWLVWSYVGDSKIPSSIRTGKACDATDSSNWFPLEEALAYVEAHPGYQLGFALGDGWAGIDLDDVIHDGKLSPWAAEIVRRADSYAEVSPSGTGAKIFLLGTLKEPREKVKIGNGEGIEIYSDDRYFAVTGKRINISPKEVKPSPVLAEVEEQLFGGDVLLGRIKLFGFYLETRGKDILIRCPWSEEHSTAGSPRDAALELRDNQIHGYHCFHASHKERRLRDVRKFFAASGSFIRTAKGKIDAGDSRNYVLALEQAGVELSYNSFTRKKTLKQEGREREITDDVVRELRFGILDRLGFMPSKDLFSETVDREAWKSQFHPVRDYLEALPAWDGVARLETWLIDFLGAEDTPYVREVSRLPLLAAVARVLRPGIKFDELLILESEQGSGKSTTIKEALCPRVDWYSSDLPLGVDAKVVIERTAGRWIVEIEELFGLGKREVDQIKGFLSRGTDGPVRLAYGRESIDIPRQFIAIGTTNRPEYLKDASGNRRFWPVKVRDKGIDVEGLKSVREQIWAEAFRRVSECGTRDDVERLIRMKPELYAAAAEEQRKREVEDAWESQIRTSLEQPRKEWLRKFKGGLGVTLDEIWSEVGVDVARRDAGGAARIKDCLMRLGFRKGTVRRGEKTISGWVRGDDGKSFEGSPSEAVETVVPF